MQSHYYKIYNCLTRLLLCCFVGVLFECLSINANAQERSIILGRPTDTSITASIFFATANEFFLEYGTETGVYSAASPMVRNSAGVPDEIEIGKLLPDTRYFYRMKWRKVGATSAYSSTPEYTFHTQRKMGKQFTFTIEADEHLYDKKGVRSLYQRTLVNQANDNPDFMISLGDTFGDDHTPDQTTSADMDALHKDYLQYLDTLCHSAPFFFCLGNHEGENGYYLKQNNGANIAVYGTTWRKFYYPNPSPNSFYTGNTKSEGYGMGLPENYYAFTWGDALFVVLDVYRHCDLNEKPQNWDWTLGEEQYQWFRRTLASSNARHKFVFAHHIRGQGRGAKSMVNGAEWGGYNSKGVWQFSDQRPGWEAPIHQLMVKYGVNIFFQGHDHLYAREEVDGIVYQETPMAADSTYEIGVLANADAYTDLTLDGSGHLRVKVSPDSVVVDFIRAYLPADTVGGKRRNGEVAHSYTVRQRTTSVDENVSPTANRLQTYFSASQNLITLMLAQPIATRSTAELISIQGEVICKEELEVGSYGTTLNAEMAATGIYLIRLTQENNIPISATVAVIR